MPRRSEHQAGCRHVMAAPAAPCAPKVRHVRQTGVLPAPPACVAKPWLRACGAIQARRAAQGTRVPPPMLASPATPPIRPLQPAGPGPQRRAPLVRHVRRAYDTAARWRRTAAATGGAMSDAREVQTSRRSRRRAGHANGAVSAAPPGTCRPVNNAVPGEIYLYRPAHVSSGRFVQVNRAKVTSA